MNSRASLPLTLACLTLGVPAAAERPNIVFILTDDQGWGDVAAYGHPDAKTPHLDALAENGLLLSQFYVGSPVCSPSRATVLTGRFAPETGIHYAIGGPAGDQYNTRPWLDPETPNLYKTFGAAGYRVGHYGKWHLGASGPDGQAAPPPEAYGVHESATHNSSGPNMRGLSNANKSAVAADYAVEFIERHRDRPFFLSVWIMDPHSVLDPTEAQMEPYLELTHPAVRDTLRSSQTVYYAVLQSIDAAVGRVLAKLEETGLRENTIVVFCSDNGPSPLWSVGTGHAGAGLAGPFRGTKGSLYEGGIRVPFIVSWPARLSKGEVVRSTMSAVDLFPTLTSLAGLPAELPADLDGEDRSGVLLGTPAVRSKPLFWEYRFGNWGREIDVSPSLAMLDGDWKLLLNPDGSRVELYNVREDLNETENRARYETERVKQMSAQLLAWWEHEVPSPKLAPPFAGKSSWRFPGGLP